MKSRSRMAKISIIIPCYNAQGYICKCLDALMNQMYKDFDVILVNDCSNDDTLRVASEWVLRHRLKVKITTNEKNSGPSLSRYNGAKLSQSKWISFCDSDDWYEPEFLQKMVAKAENDHCEVVFCGYRNVIGNRLDNHPLGDKELIMSPKDAMYMDVDSLCMTLVRRDIYIQTPQPDIPNGEDMALVPLLIQGANKVGVLNDVLYNYYIRLGSASLNPSDTMIDSLLKSFNHINQNLNNCYYSEKEFLGIRNMIYGCILNLFKYSYNTKRAELIIKEFEKDYPKWSSNYMISRLPLFKRVFVKCAAKRYFLIMLLISRFHSFLLK